MIRLSELVSKLTPAEFTEIALVLFLAVFVAVAVRESTKRRATAHAASAQLPLADDAAPRGGAR